MMGHEAKAKLSRREERDRREAVQQTMRAALARLTPDERRACERKANELLELIMAQVSINLPAMRALVEHDEGAAVAAAYQVVERASIETAARCAHTLGQTPAEFLTTCREAYLCIVLDPQPVSGETTKPS